jgi:16S rRNA (cytidine1402-2'-O)-methyltransferase
VARKDQISGSGGSRSHTSRRSGDAPENNGRARRRKRTFGPGATEELETGLYVVATPIGNSSDVTLRALAVLEAAAVIACEDTRVTGKLLSRHGIATPLTTYHDHNAERVRPMLMKRLKNGETVALVSDAGTPLVSDPGYKLVRACIEARVPVTALPGPSAPLAALVVSGLPTDRFLFAGFLPTRTMARRKALAELKDVSASLIIMESARRLAVSLTDMHAALGPRPAAVARELTKAFEEVRRGTLDALARHYHDSGPPKGEVVVVIGPPDDGERVSDAHVDALLEAALERASVRDAVAEVALATGRRRAEVYARALDIERSGRR